MTARPARAETTYVIAFDAPYKFLTASTIAVVE
jgi:hypothetical protein